MFYQSDESTCAPVALMNLASWAGTTLDFKRIMRLCKTDKDGTYDGDMLKALRSVVKNLGLTMKWLTKPSLTLMDAHLSMPGRVILFSHLDSNREWHWSFWYGFTQLGGFLVDNAEFGLLDRPITEAEAIEYLLSPNCRMALVESSQFGQVAQHRSFRLPAEATRRATDGSLVYIPGSSCVPWGQCTKRNVRRQRRG